ncbi:MAG: general secretion pathway protein GspK [Comamonadaceae bacterium]|nr:MAG: general secretion pathway protein GspK [Comamonadaceae bacterium]
MLTVALVATFASAALWQQWRGVEVEAAERDRLQAGWILTGGLDWARLILREDGRSGGADHLGEPWAMPLQEARLSTFLSADSKLMGDERDSFLSGQITDLQSRLNVFNLMDGAKVSLPDQMAFERLFSQLGLPQQQVQTMVDNLRQVGVTSDAAPLRPQSIEQLAWLGLPAASVRILAPYITLLPERTTVNINTASAEVLQASVEGLDVAGAQRIVTARALTPFQALTDARSLLGREDLAFNTAAQGVNSQFFEAVARLRLDNLVVQERSLLQRQGMVVTALARRRGVVPGLTDMPELSAALR